MTKKPGKEEIILAIFKELKKCSPKQLFLMYEVLKMSAAVVARMTEVTQKTGMPVGIKVDVMNQEQMAAAEKNELKN